MNREVGRFAAGLALKTLLRTVTGRAEPASRVKATRKRRGRGRRPTRHPAATPGPRAHTQPRRGPAFVVMMGAIALALPLMLLFESPYTLAVGVVLLFTFVVAGVFAIADPAFLEADEEPS